MILAGDLGGTNCRLAVFDETLSMVDKRIYKCKDYQSFEEVVRHFLEHYPHPIQTACFGLPGPIKQGVCQLTNLPWDRVEVAKLVEVTGVPVTLLNDVEANAYGIETLKDDELVTIKAGSKISGGNRAIVAPGTGLGEAALIEVEGRIHALASQGGHTDFGPLNELQFGLIRYVQKEYKRVCYEFLLSGPGLVRIYNFIRENGNESCPEWLVKEMEEGDPAAAISRAAMENKCSLCVQALDMFVSILASEAANAALKFLATGGVYIGGGIAPQISEKLCQPLFMENFVNKDMMVDFLKPIPVYVIRNDRAALQGAAWYARRSLTH